jgi:hypothetical protein
VSGLEETFAGRVEFVTLDYDDTSLDETRTSLGITGRTQYVLVDPTGNIVNHWYGILDQDAIESEINVALAE